MAVLIGVGSAARETAVGVVEGDIEATTGAVLPGPGARGQPRGLQSALKS